jgi:Histidine kinase-, DNA gyrase B-, and HSP90-like ATPase
MSVDELRVTSHVGRDLLQSAALFKHEHSVVWEYVANGLEYVEPGVNPTVKVTVDTRSHKISIADNGRGMTYSDLRRYFQMHGENIDRKKGAAGRGLFGTGKSAAFGIASLLRVTTVHDGVRSKVELNRTAIESESADRHVPVITLENSVPTGEPNGTIIEIEKIQLKRIDQNSIIRHIERHIAHWPNAAVFVNLNKCEFIEPPISSTHVFCSKGTPFEAGLGDVELKIKVAKAPLEEELQGIAIISSGVWHETSLVGSDRKPFANYIFGSIDVPALAATRSPISPFDMSRSMRLNPRNETVAQIYGFIGPNIERVRSELEKLDRERRNAAEAKELEKEASVIAEIINRDFAEWKMQIRKVTAQFSGHTDVFSGTALGDNENVLVSGDELPASVVDMTGGPGPLGGNGTSRLIQLD